MAYASLQHAAQHCNTLQHTTTHCNTLQHTVTHTHTQYNTTIELMICTTLQHSATHCTTLSHSRTCALSVYLSHHHTLLIRLSLLCMPPPPHTPTGFNKIIKSDIRDRMNDYILHMIGFRICIPAHIMISIIYVYQNVNSHKKYICGLPMGSPHIYMWASQKKTDLIMYLSWSGFILFDNHIRNTEKKKSPLLVVVTNIRICIPAHIMICIIYVYQQIHMKNIYVGCISCE